MTKCYFEEGYLDTSVYLWEELPCGQSIQGPAIIIDKNRQAYSLSTPITTLSDPLYGLMPRLHKSAAGGNCIVLTLLLFLQQLLRKKEIEN